MTYICFSKIYVDINKNKLKKLLDDKKYI
jgi:hypothetical protein